MYGHCLTALARGADNNWIYVVDENSNEGWIKASWSKWNGNINDLDTREIKLPSVINP